MNDDDASARRCSLRFIARSVARVVFSREYFAVIALILRRRRSQLVSRLSDASAFATARPPREAALRDFIARNPRGDDTSISSSQHEIFFTGRD